MPMKRDSSYYEKVMSEWQSEWHRSPTITLGTTSPHKVTVLGTAKDVKFTCYKSFIELNGVYVPLAMVTFVDVPSDLLVINVHSVGIHLRIECASSDERDEKVEYILEFIRRAVRENQ